jgi:hypothetical protein
MEGSTAVAPPQRVCPECARISWATGPQCPYCTARFRNGRGIRPWQLALAAAIVLLGTLVMFVIAGRIIEDRVNDRIEEVNRDFDDSLNRFRSDVKKELDARIPATGAIPTPTVPPVDTPAPTPDAGAQPTVAPTETPSPTTTAEATPTESPTTEIRP